MRALIDADVLLHELGWSSQFKDKDSGEDILLSADHCIQMLDDKIKVIQEECMADDAPTLFITSSEWMVDTWNRSQKFFEDREKLTHTPNFRYDVSVTKAYKGTRKNPKPEHFYNLAAHMMDSYHLVISQGGLEADDEICIAQREALRNGEETIICSRDKDLRICKGWHYSWECGGQKSLGPVETDELGYLYKKIKIKDDEETKEWDVIGYGLSFFLYQLIVGDTADNIPGLPKKGKTYAWNLLSELAVEGKKSEMIKAVKDAYKEKMGDNSQEYFLEQANLLWMIQKRGDNFDLGKFK